MISLEESKTPFEKLRKEECEIINEIANELAYNYISNSFGDTDKNEIEIESISSNKDFTKKFKKRTPEICRNIIIVGAGASKDAYRELPTGNNMIEGFETKYTSNIKSAKFLKNKYEQIVNETKSLSQYGFNFENFLYILSNYFVTQQSLRQEIRHYTNFRYSPSFFYQLILEEAAFWRISQPFQEFLSVPS